MKVSFFEKSIKKSNRPNEEKRIKKYFQILLLVFTVTLFTFVLSINEVIKENEIENSNPQDYVSVFNETNLKKVLFYSHEDSKEKWEKLKRN